MTVTGNRAKSLPLLKNGDRLSESEQAQERAIILLLLYQMTEQQQERAIAVLKTVCQA
jgi:dTDP-4-amino-4,6-dideoxygalactose transaminase